MNSIDFKLLESWLKTQPAYSAKSRKDILRDIKKYYDGEEMKPRAENRARQIVQAFIKDNFK